MLKLDKIEKTESFLLNHKLNVVMDKHDL